MDWSEIALRLGAATLLGAAIGLDRELLHKSAGVRTIGLMALGSALASVVMVSVSGGDIAAASRVIQGTLAGIGFLGGGVILRQGTHVEGLTTAASVWAAAALGAACGLGAWMPVLIGGGLTLILLVVAGWIEYRLKRRAGRTPSDTE